MILSLFSKGANKNENESDNKVDIPFEEWVGGENINIYITGQRVVNNTFYKSICEGKVYNNGIKSCEKDGIIKFTYDNFTYFLAGNFLSWKLWCFVR